MRAWHVESMAMACLENMSDDGVLDGVEMLARRSNAITTELLSYLIEVERRGLHLREACSSLFAFCVERLHMSEAAAGKRITAARTARRFPRVLEMLAGGEQVDRSQVDVAAGEHLQHPRKPPRRPRRRDPLASRRL